MAEQLLRWPWFAKPWNWYVSMMQSWKENSPLWHATLSPLVHYVIMPVAVFVLMPGTITATSGLLVLAGINTGVSQ